LQLLSGRGAAEAGGDIGPVDRLGFLGPQPFAYENQDLSLSDFLGFPWILSSETRLINGLCGINRAKIF
jgi:hypothetical protein